MSSRREEVRKLSLDNEREGELRARGTAVESAAGKAKLVIQASRNLSTQANQLVR